MMNKTLIIGILFGLTSCLSFDLETQTDEAIDLTPPEGSLLPSTVRSGDTLLLQEGLSFALLGALRVQEGAVLKIEPGVTITAVGGQPPSLFIAVEAGAKILAEGTDEAPIVFTASDQVPGAWGGLIIAGRAPINIGNSAIAEIGDITYGGSQSDDSSGILKYVRVEYSGSAINSEREHNGITFYGVGSGTEVDFIQTFKGADDGIELFGGTVNLSHVACIGSQDDQFDYTQGWTGTVEYLYIQQIDDVHFVQDRGIEADNLSSDNRARPFSSPTIRKVTLKGFESAANALNFDADAMRIREGTKGHFQQVLITNYPGNALDIRGIVTIENLVNQELTFQDIYVDGITDGTHIALDPDESDPQNLLEASHSIVARSITNTPHQGAELASWRGRFIRTD